MQQEKVQENFKPGVPDISPSEARPPLSVLRVYDHAGSSILVNEIKGIVHYINFWAEWCQPCLTEIPLLMKLQTEFAGQVQISLINLDTNDDSVEKARKFQRASAAAAWTLYNEKEKLKPLLNTSSIPYHIIVDKNGGIAAIFTGSVIKEEEKIRLLIRRLASE